MARKTSAFFGLDRPDFKTAYDAFLPVKDIVEKENHKAIKELKDKSDIRWFELEKRLFHDIPIKIDELVVYKVALTHDMFIYVTVFQKHINVINIRDDYADWRRNEPYFWATSVEDVLLEKYQYWCARHKYDIHDFLNLPVKGLSIGCSACNSRESAKIMDLASCGEGSNKAFYLLPDGSYLSKEGYRDVSAFGPSGKKNATYDEWDFIKWREDHKNLKDTCMYKFIEKRVSEQIFEHVFIVKKRGIVLCISNMPASHILEESKKRASPWLCA